MYPYVSSKSSSAFCYIAADDDDSLRLDWASVSLHKYTQTRVMQLSLRQSDCIYRGKLADVYLCHLSDFWENDFCKS